MKPLVLALGCVLSLGVVGCGGEDKPAAAPPTAPPSTPPTALATVQGKLLMVGGPAPGVQEPAPGTLTIKRAASSVTAEIGEDGTFAIQLPEGRYRITATSPGYLEGRGLCVTDPAETTLTAGKTVTSDVYCSMK